LIRPTCSRGHLPAQSFAARGRLTSTLAAALHVVTRPAVAAAPAVQGKAIGLVVVAVLALLGALLRLVLLPAGDEGR
jgi:hypothetical protein